MHMALAASSGVKRSAQVLSREQKIGATDAVYLSWRTLIRAFI